MVIFHNKYVARYSSDSLLIMGSTDKSNKTSAYVTLSLLPGANTFVMKILQVHKRLTTCWGQKMGSGISTRPCYKDSGKQGNRTCMPACLLACVLFGYTETYHQHCDIFCFSLWIFKFSHVMLHQDMSSLSLTRRSIENISYKYIRYLKWTRL